MTPTLFVAWVVVLAVVLASYGALAWSVLLATTVPRRQKWWVLVPPACAWVAMRASGWPRAFAILWLVASAAYATLRLLA